MVLHYIFIGIYFAALAGIVLTVIHVSRHSRKRDGNAHRPSH